MKRLLLSSTFIVLVAGPAMAVDHAAYKRPRPAVVMVPAYSWTGFYLGATPAMASAESLQETKAS